MAWLESEPLDEVLHRLTVARWTLTDLRRLAPKITVLR